MRLTRLVAAAIVAAAVPVLVPAGLAAAGDGAPVPDRTAESRDMTPETLLDLTERFLDDRFDLNQAQALFGPVVDASNPNNYVAQPRDPAIERLVYGTVERDGARPLMSIFIKYRNPLRIDLAALTGRLGDPRRGARLKPHQPRPHIFDVKGADHAGLLTLGLAPGEGPVRDLVTLHLARLLPDG